MSSTGKEYLTGSDESPPCPNQKPRRVGREKEKEKVAWHVERERKRAAEILARERDSSTRLIKGVKQSEVGGSLVGSPDPPLGIWSWGGGEEEEEEEFPPLLVERTAKRG